jgi:hypothetical protein
MRLLASCLALVLASVLGCAGDTSALMSVWNDGGPGGTSTPSSGGAGGGGGGTLAVPGGTRDLATTQCTVTADGTCQVPSDSLTCLEGKCGSNLTDCYYSDGVSAAAGGRCQSYANCMLACPCDSGRSNCEATCLQKYAPTDSDCLACITSLLVCSSIYGCTPPTTCGSPSGGAGGSYKT